jgi:hypothetical protein
VCGSNRSWKLGADAYGRNYYYNYITGESTWDKPEGWEPLPEEMWIKNTDERGNTYYYHILTGESRSVRTRVRGLYGLGSCSAHTPTETLRHAVVQAHA